MAWGTDSGNGTGGGDQGGGTNPWDVASAGAGVIGGLLDAQGNASAQVANQKNINKIGNLYTTGLTQLSSGYGKAIATQKGATAGLKKGFQSALLNASQTGNQAKKGILERSDQNLATTQGNLINRGLGSSSIADQARTAQIHDTNSALAGVDESIANLIAMFETKGAEAVAGSQSQEANLWSRLGEGQQSGTQGYMDVLKGVQHTSSGGAGAGLGSIVSLAALAFSDPRLKKNVVRHGVISARKATGGRDIPIYTYEYRSKKLPGRYIGVMAPDVEHMGVVSTSPVGYQMVDYVNLRELTGFEFKRLDAEVGVS